MASREYDKSTVVVAIYDQATEQVLWRGALHTNIDLFRLVEQCRELIRANLGKLFDKIPDSKPRFFKRAGTMITLFQ